MGDRSPPRGGGGGGFRGGRGGRGRDDSRSLHCRGYDVAGTDAGKIRNVFAPFGDVVDVYLPREYHTKELRGFAYVQFADEADAEKARTALDRSDIFGDGKTCAVMWASGNRKTPVDMRRIDVERENPHAMRLSPGRRREAREMREARGRRRPFTPPGHGFRRRRSVSPRAWDRGWGDRRDRDFRDRSPPRSRARYASPPHRGGWRGRDDDDRRRDDRREYRDLDPRDHRDEYDDDRDRDFRDKARDRDRDRDRDDYRGRDGDRDRERDRDRDHDRDRGRDRDEYRDNYRDGPRDRDRDRERPRDADPRVDRDKDWGKDGERGRDANGSASPRALPVGARSPAKDKDPAPSPRVGVPVFRSAPAPKVEEANGSPADATPASPV